MENSRIKFRAWDEENKMFHYFTLFDIWKNIKYPSHVITNHKVYHIKDLPTDQYIGLKDKNKKEIYEGDVVKAQHQKERKIIGDQFEKIEVVGEVKYEAPSFFLKLENSLTQNWLDFDSSAEPYEIIGNIYENPELAK